MRRRTLRNRKLKMIIITEVFIFVTCIAVAYGISKEIVVKKASPEWLFQTLSNSSVENSRYINGSSDENSRYLVLVNKDNPLPEDYSVTLKTLNNGRSQVDETIYDALKEMLTDGTNEGLDFCVASAYRSTERQEEILNADINDYIAQGMDYDSAYNEAVKQVMPPGYSEHETGLALDIVAADYQLLDENQETTEENIWLRENCWKYGFILRYPADKEDITKISYESWHFRYVGKEAAEYITKNGLCLEEYTDL